MIFLELDPDVVKPGWTAFVVVILLVIAMVFLYLSMRKQFRKIRVHEEEEALGDGEDSTSQQPPRTQS